MATNGTKSGLLTTCGVAVTLTFDSLTSKFYLAHHCPRVHLTCKFD